MLRFSLTFLITLTIWSTCLSQPAVESILTYDTGRDDGFLDVYSCEDNGFVMSGGSTNNWITYRGENNNTNLLIVRVDEQGEILWSREYAGGVTCLGWSIIETDEGGFLVGSQRGGQFSALLVDADGNQIWWRDYASGTCRSVIELKGGDFLLTGLGRIDGDLQGPVFCVNGEGNVIWSDDYGVGGTSVFYSMRETEDGVVLAGYQGNTWVVKINFEGEVVWDRQYEGGSISTSIVSGQDEGFVLTGWPLNVAYPLLMKISPQGDLDWGNQNNDGVPIAGSHGTCVEKAPNGNGYYVVGRSSQGDYQPFALRITSQGVTRWQEVYNFGELENFQAGRNEFNSIAVDRTGSPIAAGVVRHFEEDEDHWSYDGILMKFAPEIVGPQFIYWSPEDTLITALPGDTLQFIARAESPFEEELVYGWSINDSLISRDTTVTVSFENLGNYILKCLVSDAETTISITWQIEVTDWYIAAFSPDSLNLQVGRGTNIPFTTNLRAVENEEMSRLWTYTGRDDQQEELGEGDSVDVNFNLSGVHHLQFEVWDDNRTEEIAWDVTVNSIVWSWVPQANVISAVEDTTITFEIIPFNEDSDSIECIWMINEAPFSVGLSSEVLFSDVGNYDVNAFVTESEDTDTIIWNIEILERQDVADNGSQELPAKPTLYPPSPNPFNSHIQIPVYTPDNCKVELSVFDVNGRKITSKILEGISGGNHIWTWHPKDCPAGLYLVRMQSRSSTQARKILLLK